MLTPDDRKAIEGLFDRLAQVERRTPERDREAEDLIAREVVRQPGAPYYMAQTILVQQHALEQAEQRIAALEQQASRRGGGLFGGLFGDDRPAQPPRATAPTQQSRSGPWDRDEQTYQRGQGGGFLAGAAQTALGVAGGVLLGNAIAGMFSTGSAQASEADPAPEPDAQADADTGADNDFDSDFGGGDGGFDMGGDF